jgi:hypothetical protein
MPDLTFQVESASAVSFAAAPLLNFKLRIANADPELRIQTIALRCQIQLDVTKRHYTEGEHEKLLDLFGEPERWGRTLRAMLWTHTSTVVTPFRGSTVVDLPVPCTFDFNVAAAKYLAGLEDGEAPLNLLFSGTVFYEAENGALQVEQISWDKEARYRLPVSVWKEMMALYYPNLVWLCLDRDVFDRFAHYKSKRGIPTWDLAIESLLKNAEEPQSAHPDIEEISAEEMVQ